MAQSLGGNCHGNSATAQPRLEEPRALPLPPGPLRRREGQGRSPDEACDTILGEYPGDDLWACCRQVIMPRLPGSLTSSLSRHVRNRSMQTTCHRTLIAGISSSRSSGSEAPFASRLRASSESDEARMSNICGGEGGGGVTHRRLHASLQLR